eukprot:scaffold113434_cov60-Phaeocystis_antarctica.AAC.4
MAHHARHHQRGAAVIVLHVDRRALVEQQLHHLRVAPLARLHQRGVAVLVLLVDRRAIIEQLLHQLRVAGVARLVKWAHGAIERMRGACQVLPRRPVAVPVGLSSSAPVGAISASACHRVGRKLPDVRRASGKPNVPSTQQCSTCRACVKYPILNTRACRASVCPPRSGTAAQSVARSLARGDRVGPSCA